MAVASAIDLVLGNVADTVFSAGGCLASRETSSKAVEEPRFPVGRKMCLAACYLFVGHFVMCIHDTAFSNEYSFFLFSGAAVQTVAVFTLCVKVRASKSVEGISSQSLTLMLASLGTRLACTTLYDGYISADHSGDYAYQVIEVCALLGVIYLLYSTHRTYAHTYQEEHDNLPIVNITVACLGLATCLHGNLNRDWFMDTLWAFSLNLEVVQMLPHVYMLAKVGGLVDNTTAHYVANMFFSCVLRSTFWVWAIPGCEELSSPEGYRWNMEVAGYYILIAHFLELLIVLDFMYYYVKAMRAGSAVSLPKLDETPPGMTVL